MAQVKRERGSLLAVHAYFRHDRDVVGAALCGSCVAMATFWIRHGLLLLLSVDGVLAQSRIVLGQLQPIRRVALVLGGDDKMLAVFGAYQPDDFSNFAFFLRHAATPVWGLRSKYSRSESPGATVVSSWPGLSG